MIARRRSARAALRRWMRGLRRWLRPRGELVDGPLWISRAAVIAAAVAAGLLVVGFTALSEAALAGFHALHARWPWAPLLWTPLCTGGVVWLTRRWAPGAAGSGIPQVMVALDPSLSPAQRRRFVSGRLSLSKLLLTAGGLLGGLSLGREGPSVQIAAGVMAEAGRLLPRRSAVTESGLLVAGGAAGIAAAFNTPLGGVMFAIEELSRTPEQRSPGLLVAGIVLAGLVAVSLHGNGAYFGVIHVPALSLALLGPGLLVALAAGLSGGLFSRLLILSLTGRPRTALGRWRQARPVSFAVACGLAVALLGLATGGAVFGSGYSATRGLLQGEAPLSWAYAPLKLLATWWTAWSGVPAGVFAPSLAIGAAVGHDVAVWTACPQAPALIALGMAGFLAAVTQAPLTAFIIVMEMVDGHGMVLSLMACALVASGVGRLVSPPLYPTLARHQRRHRAGPP